MLTKISCLSTVRAANANLTKLAIAHGLFMKLISSRVAGRPTWLEGEWERGGRGRGTTTVSAVSKKSMSACPVRI